MLKLAMTLSERNTFFKVAMVFCSIVTLLVIAASFRAIPIYPLMEENTHRPGYFIQLITGLLLETDYLAVHASLALAVLFSLISMILIHAFFERTSAPEILYIALFAFSLSFEIIRLIVPLHLYNVLPLFYLTTAARVLLFARYFSIFSLFTASVCAAGLEIQRTRNVVLFLLVPSLVISLGVPVDAQTWDTCFNFAAGYASMFLMIEIIVFFGPVISFFVAAHNRRSKEYYYVGIGVAIALTGRNVLLGVDNWAGPVIGILFLTFGTWLMCSRLHKIHLWL